MSSKVKVLLVEDMKIAQLAIKASLASLNWQLDTAENGRTAIEYCSRFQYDLILMDLGLPDISGFEATKIIKQQYPETPIVALTAHFDELNRHNALDCGMSGFIQKPLTQDKLKDISILLVKKPTIDLYCA